MERMYIAIDRRNNTVVVTSNNAVVTTSDNAVELRTLAMWKHHPDAQHLIIGALPNHIGGLTCRIEGGRFPLVKGSIMIKQARMEDDDAAGDTVRPTDV